jgi:3-methylcrotonyl-CoA carboxylase alpha subunit
MRTPHGLDRLEIGVRAGDSISPFYDSMIAKLIAHGPTRDAALSHLARELGRTVVVGIPSNGVFLKRLVELDSVRHGQMDTGLIAREMAGLTRTSVTAADRCAAVAHFLGLEAERGAGGGSRLGGPAEHWRATDGFQLGGGRTSTVTLLVDGTPDVFRVLWPIGNEGWPSVETRDGTAVSRDGRAMERFSHGGTLHAVLDGETVVVSRPIYDANSVDDGNTGDTVRAPINGKVARVFVSEGHAVAKGDRIAVVEAMKMEHVLHALRDGTIAKVAVREGQQVNQGTLIVSLVEG